MVQVDKMYTVQQMAMDIDAIARVSKLVDDVITIEKNEPEVAEIMRSELDALTDRAESYIQGIIDSQQTPDGTSLT